MLAETAGLLDEQGTRELIDVDGDEARDTAGASAATAKLDKSRFGLLNARISGAVGVICRVVAEHAFASRRCQSHSCSAG